MAATDPLDITTWLAARPTIAEFEAALAGKAEQIAQLDKTIADRTAALAGLNAQYATAKATKDAEMLALISRRQAEYDAKSASFNASIQQLRASKTAASAP